MTKGEMIEGYRKSLRKMTDSLYHRQLESIKLESMATTDLVDMLRERDKHIEKLEKENGKLEGKLTKAKGIITNLVAFDGNYEDDEEYQRTSELYDKIQEEAEQFLKE